MMYITKKYLMIELNDRTAHASATHASATVRSTDKIDVHEVNAMFSMKYYINSTSSYYLDQLWPTTGSIDSGQFVTP